MGNLIAVIADRDEKEALENIRVASGKEKISMLEIREQTMLNSNLDTIIDACRLPAIYTLRSESEGGSFEGNHDERKRILEYLIKKEAPYFDNELFNYVKLDKKKSKEIISYHNAKITPSNLKVLFTSAKNIGADVIKLVTATNTKEDAKVIYELYDFNSMLFNKDLIAFGMANRERDGLSIRLARETRIYAYKHGFGTFVVIDKDKAVVPGQLSYDEFMTLTNNQAVA